MSIYIGQIVDILNFIYSERARSLVVGGPTPLNKLVLKIFHFSFLILHCSTAAHPLVLKKTFHCF